MSEENLNVETEGEIEENADDENVMTLNDVLDMEDDLIENTAALLGAANDKTCSYAEVRYI